MIDEYLEKVLKNIVKANCDCMNTTFWHEGNIDAVQNLYSLTWHSPKCPTIQAQWALTYYGIKPRWRINRKK